MLKTYNTRAFLTNPDQIPGYILDTLIWLGYSNSFANPILYLYLNNHFRVTLSTILKFDWFKTTNQPRNKENSFSRTDV